MVTRSNCLSIGFKNFIIESVFSSTLSHLTEHDYFLFFRESHNVETCEIISFESEHISQSKENVRFNISSRFFPDFTDISIVADKLQSFSFFLSLFYFSLNDY